MSAIKYSTKYTCSMIQQNECKKKQADKASRQNAVKLVEDPPLLPLLVHLSMATLEECGP